ncbi:MAG TPA: Gfo/Idh/MocA family oxidoreductase [Solirubrobacterales bacterium]
MPGLRVAIVGYGLSGRYFHAPLIGATDGLSVGAVVTSDPVRRAEAEADHPGVRVFGRLEEALDDGPDLVVVAAPNTAHVAVARAAIDHGVPVVVDKPLAGTVAEAEELVDRARSAGVPLTVFHNRRWDSEQLTLRRLLGEGTLGTVSRYESRFERWRPAPSPDRWREALSSEQGGGVLLDLGTHLVDQALALFGPPSHVYAEVDARRGTPGDDDAFVALRHRGGTVSHLWASAVTAVPAARLRVQGSKAGFEVAALDPQENALRAGRSPREPGWGLPGAAEYQRLVRDDQVEAVAPEPGDWRRFYVLLRDALTAGGPPPVEPEEGVAVLQIIEAARRSASDGIVVALPESGPP